MIQYSLKCEHGHGFDSWFKSASAFDTLKRAGHVTCPVCGSSQVDKAIMAPRVRPARSAAAKPPATQPPATQPPGTQPDTAPAPMAAGQEAEIRAAIEAMREKVEKNSSYVGNKFADEARAMHLGDSPERSIYGEARPEEAKALIEDGVPVMPLPFRPTRKSN